jgi:cytochrome P450
MTTAKNTGSTTEESTDGGDLFAVMDTETARRPQPSYKLLRQSSPILRMEGAGVIVSARADVDELLRKPEVFSSNMSAVDLKNVRPLIPLQIDPPMHRKFRRILDPLFSPQRMRELEPAISSLVNELIDGFADDDEIDFCARFSVPFPSQVFLTMLGLPLDELPRFLGMKDGIIRPHYVVGTTQGHPDAIAHQEAIAASIYEYFETALDERTNEPRDDLLTRFLDAEMDGARLSREDILDICFLFLIAGLDTVSASLDCFFAYLAEHPEARAQIVADPAVVPRVVEELLRWESPVVAVPRIAIQDTELGGCPISAGEHVTALIGSANVDDDALADAEHVRFDRIPNRHVAFGAGIHRCLGLHLARVELQVALREWHARLPDYRIAPGVELNFTAGIRSLDVLPLVLRTTV